MKQFKSIKIMALVMAVTIGSAMAQERDGQGVGNGGNNLDIEVWSIASRTKTLLMDASNCLQFPEFVVETPASPANGDVPVRTCGTEAYTTFMQALSNHNEITVEFTDRPLIVNGVRKVAINDPGRHLIRVNRDAWLAVQENIDKISLVFHEFMGVSGLMLDLNYALSTRFADLLRAKTWVCSAGCIYGPYFNRGFLSQQLTFYGTTRGEAYTKIVDRCDRLFNGVPPSYGVYREYNQTILGGGYSLSGTPATPENSCSREF